MSNRAWMPLHITDYLADTGHLTAAEHGAYLMLIMHYWQNGSLPADERLLQRLTRMSKDEWAESRDVLAMLFGENWSHKRIDEELAKADEIIEKRRSAANARHAKNKSDAHAEQVDSKSSDTGALPRTLDQGLKEEPNGSSKKRACRIPDDFRPDLAWAVGAGLSPQEAELEAANFRGYWTAKAGKDAAKLNWPVTWEVWVRNSLKRRPSSRASPARQAAPRGSEHFYNLAEETDDEPERAFRSGQGNRHDAGGVPVLTISDYRRHG